MFIVVGLAATLVHFLMILALVDVLGWMGPTAATGIGSVIGISVSYLGNHRFVFNAQGQHAHYALRFVFTYLVVTGIHTSLMYLFTEFWGLRYEWGFVTATVISAATTFLANRYLVFKPPITIG